MSASYYRRFVRRPILALAAVASDPLEALTNVQERRASSREIAPPPDFYTIDHDWEGKLHRLLRLPKDETFSAEFNALWPKVIQELEAKGLRPGPESYKTWNDGDAAFVRAIWCITRQLKPQNVVETGVAHGVTSRFILEALELNGNGHLWSIDRPPLEPEWRKEIGIAVDDRLRHRWSYIEGASRRRLPGLLAKLGEIELFIHDSLHSENNVRFEIDLAAKSLRQGGAIVIDDIDTNRGFRSFTQSFSGYHAMACESEPVRPDLRRFNSKGLFGILVKGEHVRH